MGLRCARCDSPHLTLISDTGVTDGTKLRWERDDCDECENQQGLILTPRRDRSHK